MHASIRCSSLTPPAVPVSPASESLVQPAPGVPNSPGFNLFVPNDPDKPTSGAPIMAADVPPCKVLVPMTDVSACVTLVPRAGEPSYGMSRCTLLQPQQVQFRWLTCLPTGFLSSRTLSLIAPALTPRLLRSQHRHLPRSLCIQFLQHCPWSLRIWSLQHIPGSLLHPRYRHLHLLLHPQWLLFPRSQTQFLF